MEMKLKKSSGGNFNALFSSEIHVITMFIQTYTLFRQNCRSPFEFLHSFLLKVKTLSVLKSGFKNYGRSTFLEIHLLLYVSISEDFFPLYFLSCCLVIIVNFLCLES